MKAPTPRKLLLGLLACASLAALPTPAQTATFSLAGDFDINVNSAASTWSYGTVTVPASTPFVMKLLDTNTKTMASIFTSDTALPVWGSTETAWAYWMLGKNTGATAIHSLWGDTLDWQPGTVMLYPGQEGRNLLVSWLAPSDMAVDAHWTFTRVSARKPDSPWPAGQGTDYRVTLRSGTGDTTVVDFAGAARPGGTLYDSHSSSFTGLSVQAGDRLFWEIAGFNNSVDVDATEAGIEITEVVQVDYTASLANDYDINVNSTASTWSYGTVTVPASTPFVMKLLDTNTKTMASIFTSDTALPVWGSTETAWAYWMLGKNTGATAIHSLWGDTLDWQPGTVMLYPGQEGRNLLVSWLAPSDMAVDAHWTFTRVSARKPDSPWPAGQGTDYRVTLRSGTGDTTVADFAGAARPGGTLYDSHSSSFTGLSVLAGDRLFWEIAGFNNSADVDATEAAIEITGMVTPGKPAITVEPLGGTVVEGSDFTFSVVASGLPAYQWTKGGIPIPGATNSSHPIILVRTIDAGTYTVILTNNGGSVTSAPAILNVTPIPPGYTASLANDFDINVNSTGSTWSYGTVTVPASTPFVMKLLDTNTKTMASIFNSDTALPVWGSTETAWAYWMLGKNTEPATISGLWGDTLDFQPDTVMLYPGQEGRNLLVSWRAPRDMIVEANWTFTRVSERRPDSPWPAGVGTDYRVTHRSSAGDTTVVNFGGVAQPGGTLYDSHSSSLAGLSVHAGDRLFWEIAGFGGTVDVDATGAAIEIAEVTTVSPPTILTDPSGGTVAEGCNFIFSATGNGATGTLWYRNGNPIPGATATSYSVIDGKTSDAGAYTVVLTNTGGSVTSAPAVLTVTARPTYTTVVFTESFSGYFGGNQYNVQYQSGLKLSQGGNLPMWGKAGAGAIHAVDRTGAGNYAAMIWQDNVLTLASAIAANESGATYHVDFVAGPSISNIGDQGTGETDGMVIDVLRGDDSVLETYTCQPGAWAGAASFTPFTFPYVGDGSGDVRIRISPLALSGHFGGQIDNLRVGTDYVPTTPPKITLDPSGGTVLEGSDFTFSVVASGMPAYQWTKGGIPIPGATSSSYPVIDVRTKDAGTYTAILKNNVGSVTSAPAILNVTPGPIYTSYSKAVLADNPIHYYPLDDTDGVVAADLGSLAISGGTYTGGFTLGEASATAGLGTSVRLDGAPGSLVDLGVFHPGDSVTVEAWANLDPADTKLFNAIVARWDGSYELGFTAQNLANCNVRNDADAIGQAFGASSSARCQWHHLVGVFTEGTLSLYVDGVKGLDQAIGGVLRDAGPTPDRVMIGATRDGSSSSSFNFKGLIDEVAIYDTALSAPQIRAHYRAAQSERPSLSIERTTEGAVLISWSFSPGYVLQSATNVTGPYEKYTGSIAVSCNNLSTAQVLPGSAPGFFRLFRP